MICKYEGTNIDFDLTSKGLADSPEYAAMVKAIEECDMVTENILSQYAEIDSSIRQWRDEVYAVSEGMLGFSEGLIDGVGSMKIKNDDDAVAATAVAGAGLALAAVGGLVQLGGSLIAKRKQKKAIEERDRKLDEALEVKKAIAEEKYDHLKKFKEMFVKTVGPRIEASYNKDFAMEVEAGEALLQKKVDLFKRDVGLLVKTRFLTGTLDFLLAEMQAWMQGKHDSGQKRGASAMKILDEIIGSWPKALGSGQKWSGFVETWLDNTTHRYPVAVAFLFTEPALLSNYVGINFNILDNCDTALLKADYETLDKENHPAGELYASNPYFKDCKENLSKNFNPPHWPESFGFKDIICISIPIILAFLIAFATFSIFPGTFMRVVGTVIAAAVVFFSFSMFLGEDLDMDLPEIELPYDKAYSEYSYEYEKMVRAIREQEAAARNKFKIIKI